MSKKWIELVFLFVLLTVASTACGPTVNNCVTDANCASSEKCYQYSCKKLDYCQADNDCQSPRKCIDNKCVEPVQPCQKDTDCRDPRICQDKKCVDPPSCKSNGDCKQATCQQLGNDCVEIVGESCDTEKGVCKRGIGATPPVKNATCKANKCVPKEENGTCKSNADCEQATCQQLAEGCVVIAGQRCDTAKGVCERGVGAAPPNKDAVCKDNKCVPKDNRKACKNDSECFTTGCSQLGTTCLQSTPSACVKGYCEGVPSLATEYPNSTCLGSYCTPTGKVCSSDANCKENELCEKGRCLEIRVPCQQNQDCNVKKIAVCYQRGDKCREATTKANSCQNGFCALNGVGSRTATCDSSCLVALPECGQGVGCGVGARCNQGKCEAIPGYCKDKSDCKSDLDCVDNVCTRPNSATCKNHTDCGTGAICDTGTCKVVTCGQSAASCLGGACSKSGICSACTSDKTCPKSEEFCSQIDNDCSQVDAVHASCLKDTGVCMTVPSAYLVKNAKCVKTKCVPN